MSLRRDQASIARGQTAQWDVSVSAESGKIADVTLKLTTSPSSLKPVFSFGCSSNSDKETNSCPVGTVHSSSAPAQLQAQVPVAKTATSVKSVQLTVAASGTGVTTAPQASVPVSVTAPAAKAPASPPASSSAPPSSPAQGSTAPGTTFSLPPPAGVTSTLPAGELPYLNGGGSTLNPGGSASSLFPTLSPSAGGSSSANQNAPDSRTVADTLPSDASVLGAQYAGLGALALAFILTITRLSIRRRQNPKPRGGDPR